MAQKIVGFFERHNAADAVVDKLTESGLGEERILLLAERVEGSRYSHLGAMDSMNQSLRSSGMTEGEAESFGRGIRDGGIVVMVTAHDDQVDEVSQVMIAGGAVEIDGEAREQKPQQRGPQRDAALPFDPHKPPLRERVGGVKTYVHVE